jgi:hypothetical protein
MASFFQFSTVRTNHNMLKRTTFADRAFFADPIQTYDFVLQVVLLVGLISELRCHQSWMTKRGFFSISCTPPYTHHTR